MARESPPLAAPRRAVPDARPFLHYRAVACSCRHTVVCNESATLIKTAGEGAIYAHFAVRLMLHLAGDELYLDSVFGAAHEHTRLPFLCLTLDNVCSFLPYLRRRDPDAYNLLRSRVYLGQVHQYAHLCIKQFGTTFKKGVGRGSGEEIEVLWSHVVMSENAVKHYGASKWIDRMRASVHTKS